MCRDKKKTNFIPVHSVCQTLAQDVRRNLSTIHSLSGCDSTSQFAGYGKKSMWKIFLQSPSLLAKLGHDNHLSEDRISYVEEFVVKLYMPASDMTSIDTLRARLFRQKSPDALPPTHDALVQHMLRVNYQALIWYKSIESKLELPPAQDSGWELNPAGQLQTKLLSQPAIPQTCVELLTCSCKTQCRRITCTCQKNQLHCTRACKCHEKHCMNPYKAVYSDVDSD